MFKKLISKNISSNMEARFVFKETRLLKKTFDNELHCFENQFTLRISVN